MSNFISFLFFFKPQLHSVVNCRALWSSVSRFSVAGRWGLRHGAQPAGRLLSRPAAINTAVTPRASHKITQHGHSRWALDIRDMRCTTGTLQGGERISYTSNGDAIYDDLLFSKRWSHSWRHSTSLRVECLADWFLYFVLCTQQTCLDKHLENAAYAFISTAHWWHTLIDDTWFAY